MKVNILTCILCVAQSLLPHTSASPTQRYSQWMLSSIMSRNQGIMTGMGDSSEPLQVGYTQKVLTKYLYDNSGHSSTKPMRQYLKKSVDSTVPFFGNATRNLVYPLDRFSSGNGLINAYLKTDDQKYRDTFNGLRESINLQKRNAIGGLEYYVYPNWSYLDGMYSLGPFYTRYTNEFTPDNSSAYADIYYQLNLLWDRCFHAPTSLLVHGYDYSETAVWASPGTGASPYVWGRSLGWYAMALVDTLETLASADTGDEWYQLKDRFESLAENIVKAVDEQSGAWWQIIDQPAREGNYIESSASAMFVYALLKGSRLGYVSGCSKVAARAYEYIVKSFVVREGNGTLGYNGTVAVCSLNSTATYEYYTTRPLVYNSVLGSASFVLASLEYESLSSSEHK